MKNKKIIIMQIIFLVVVVFGIYLIYPKTAVDLDGNNVRFNSINARVIMISENPDFSNPRFIDLEENVSFPLKPGTYYWKADNGIIEGFKNEFTIDSEVGLGIDEEESKLENIGNVKLNVTKNKQGVMVGHIILEPDETEDLEDAEYVGRQEK
jgi:hypothetical protein